jgi:hypothetical protein
MAAFPFEFFLLMSLPSENVLAYKSSLEEFMPLSLTRSELRLVSKTDEAGELAER